MSHGSHTAFALLAAAALAAASCSGATQVNGDTMTAAAAPPQAGAAYVTSAAPSAADEELNREGYDRIVENDFLAVADQPLSTFSIDVDTASYANVRRFLRDGSLPPKDAVRIEELINYFSYDYPQPTGDDPFAVITEVAPAPWTPEHKLVHIGLQGKRLDEGEIPPRNLVFLFDVSGSMMSADKLPLLKSAFSLLVERLDERDRVSIVVYAGAAGAVLEPTPGSDKAAILGALNRLTAGGSTNGGDGIRLAYALAEQNFDRNAINRVILATDGDFNVGTSDRGSLERLIEKKRETGVFLTVLGFGTGNLQDSQMEALADKGNGNYGYIDSLAEARKVLVREAGGTLVTIAKDVKIQVEFNPALVESYRLIGYENRLLANEDFNDDTKDAGDIGAGHTVTALYEVVLAGTGEKADPKVDPLKYQGERDLTDAAASGELMTVKLRYKQPDGDESKLISTTIADSDTAVDGASTSFRFSAAVAGFGMMLRDSKHKGAMSWGDVAQLARGAVGDDPNGYRAELLDLVRAASSLAGGDNSATVAE